MKAIPTSESISYHDISSSSVLERSNRSPDPVIASSGAKFCFTPPAGGDVSLASSDNTEFLVHSDILSLCSSVFADMFSVGTKSNDAIALADDDESVSLMLAAIYCPNSLIVRDFALLQKVLQMAQKYDIKDILNTFDTTIPLGLHGSFLETDPFRTFGICKEYGLSNTATVAAIAVQKQLCYFQDRTAVVKLGNQVPGGGAIASLAGTAAARAKILHDVLYDFQSGLPPSDSDEKPDPEVLSDLLCTTCYKTLRNWNRYPDLTFRPHWLFDWARLAFNELISKDIDKCSDLFEAGVFSHIAENADHPYCIQEVRHYKSTFNDWAGNVEQKLRSELSELARIYHS